MKKIIPGLTLMGMVNPERGEIEGSEGYLKRIALWIKNNHGYSISVSKNRNNDEYAKGWYSVIKREDIYHKEQYGYASKDQAYLGAIREFLKHNNKLK